MEKNIIPDYKKGIGSRALGILIAFGKIYIVYSTVEGNLLWRKDKEKDFPKNEFISIFLSVSF